MRTKVNGVIPINQKEASQFQVALTCPTCKKSVKLENFGIFPLIIEAYPKAFTLFIHRCPIMNCRQLIIVITVGDEIVYSYPLNTVSFDTTSIPPKVVSQLEEALVCRANNCFIACAIMLRKTLETLCDEVGVTGNNLKQRVQQLQNHVTLPPQLFAGLDNIRLLGNDAAHIESQTYMDISPNELDVSIEIVREVLKGVYQYDSLVQRLEALKKPPTP